MKRTVKRNKRFQGRRFGCRIDSCQNARWPVEADFTGGFEGTSFGQRLPKNPEKDQAALCACFVRAQAG